MADCAHCGAQNPPGSKFCNECGKPLTRVCPSCGTASLPGVKFCGECGAKLDAQIVTTPEPAPASEPVAERRLVSVLFADLVGYTSLAEGRDSEDARELLSSYFDLARTVVGRHGGVVEKFIGDAVMAVWGTPVATEDDAERAVRVALELVESIPELDTGLRARVGVLTGEAAVTVGAEGEGMVAGDLVNTASRIQSAAEPGTVLVGEATRRLTEATIAYEDAGVHELKGKAEGVSLFKALRVVSGRGGALRSAGLETPFVGRERELKLIKDLFHGCAHDGRAHLVSVTGIAGIGKSRLVWEFYKYFDGIVENVYWHRGRCLPYGDGVAYWALADMVRMRCGIAEDESPATARVKLDAALVEHILDPGERAFVAPRVAQLLGLEDQTAGDRQDLFAAWRLFFERLSSVYPTVLAFEDMQWADASLLDFVEHLLDWSRELPLYVITLARPELIEKRPTWGAGQRNFTSLYLEPLSEAAMHELLDGLVPGLPAELREQILERAQGIPLYAGETVRMLLDRGLLRQEGSVYRPSGEIQTLEVPETLQALIAARLDGLSPEERRLLQDGSVLGKTFTVAALSALAGSAPEELEPQLASLVRKEVLGFQSDPRSPERGQYGFLQDLVRHVAYETLSKRERKARHLAAAEHLAGAFADEDEVAEVLAAHYVAAVEAVPDADDAAEIRARAGEMLARAGARAAALGAPAEGRRYYEQAAALSEDPRGAAELLVRAGRLALQANRAADARALLERAIGELTEIGDSTGAARASAALSDVDVTEDRFQEGIERLELAVAQLEQSPPGPELAAAAAQLGRLQILSGHDAAAAAPLERALTLAERLQLPEVFVEALNSKALVVLQQGRLTEARILLEAAVERADLEQLTQSALRARNNLAVVLQESDRCAEASEVNRRGVQLARQRGDRRAEALGRAGNLSILVLLGSWDEALTVADEEAGTFTQSNVLFEILSTARIHLERGDVDAARALLDKSEHLGQSENPQSRAGYSHVASAVLRREGRLAEALASAEVAFAFRERGFSMSDSAVKFGYVEVLETAFELGDLERVVEAITIAESLEHGQLTPIARATTDRFQARLDAARGDHTKVDGRFRAAEALFREFGFVFHVAVTQLEHTEWLVDQGRVDEAEPLVSEASAAFEALRAAPWLERSRRLGESASPAESVAAASSQT